MRISSLKKDKFGKNEIWNYNYGSFIGIIMKIPLFVIYILEILSRIQGISIRIFILVLNSVRSGN